jgi:Protein of unknown function (DUF2846)
MFTPKAGFSQIYVYRNETLGAAISMPVTVNGKLADSKGPNSYFKFDMLPGVHSFTSQGDKSQLSLTTEANKNYFIWQEVKLGLLVVEVARSFRAALRRNLLHTRARLLHSTLRFGTVCFPDKVALLYRQL